ncbi:MAG: hypothetical protein M3P40_05670 [Actinomycetota bacterium]|nr:hypothetical protein [Actinomycetota bacterium]
MPLRWPTRSDRRPVPDVYVKLRGLTPTGIGRLRWWSRLGREVKANMSGSGAHTAGMRTGVQLARRGFYPSAPALFKLDEHPITDYVSDWQRAMTWKVNWPAAGLLDDKLAFYFMCSRLGVPTPEVSGVVTAGRTSQLGASRSGSDTDWLRDRLSDAGAIVLRPTRGGGGRGLYIVERRDDGYVINGELGTWSDVTAVLGELEDHIVSDFVRQAAYARTIFPGTTNTLRVVTMNPTDGPAFIAAAAHRFGTDKSAPGDNWSQGGISVSIDLETGRLGRGTARPTPTVPVQWVARHPTTDVPIEGTVIPNWTRIREGLVEAASKMPFLPYVGWDVIITDEGFLLAEGNKFPELGVVQVHQPLMRQARVRDFYREHGLA